MLKRQLNRRKNKVQYRGVNELRRLYLDFFESKGHLKNEKLFAGAAQ